MNRKRIRWTVGGSSAVALALSASLIGIGLTSTSSAADSSHAGRPQVVASHGDGSVKNYLNTFTANTNGWCTFSSGCDGASTNDYGTIDVVPSVFSNYGGYAPFAPPSVGNSYARVSGSLDGPTGCAVPGNENCSGPYIIYGGANAPETIFPTNGFTSSIKLYLDTAWAAANSGQVIDWDVSLNDGAGNFLQDFIFNLCSTSSAGGGFYVSASNNAGGCSTGPTELSTSGWYTFEHDFTFNSATNALNVVYSIVNSAGQTVFQSSELEDSIDSYSTLTIADLGGPNYGWFPDEDAQGLPVAMSTLTVNDANTVPPAPPTP